ncbi:hypothetical protein EVAR_40038_1 [Eumeta japonica]|uniref:Uncharacterized protein n=1 Tax=Eumeta variegata TaxID=151549 RepID=A0A4C1WAX1_EUMVA|nr:hypothetical protein EVAR_40038_1 [Eumeta japonica]
MVENSSRIVPAKSHRRELPRDVSELIRDKNAALRRADKFSTCENRLDSSIAFDDREKAECLADSIGLQCSENPSFDSEHVSRVEEELRHRLSLPPKDAMDPIVLDKVSTPVKALKIRKAPGKDFISSKALKCFSAPLVALWPRFSMCAFKIVIFQQLGRKL